MTYQLLLTTRGQQKIAAAANAGSQPVRIAEFAVGQGVNVDFSQRLDQQVLVSKRYQGAVLNVSATATSGQYEITCVVPQGFGGWTIREFGLIDSAGDLIWVGRLPEVQKPAANSTAAVDYRIKAVVSIANPDVTLVIDANVIMASQSWVANNFVSNSRFGSFLDLAYPLGYPYWSHSKSNPKPLFDAMFGFETHWRRLEGVGLVAVKDDDAYINQPMLTLGQRGVTELANSQRPHAYPIYTGYLFERYDPSTVVETVWKVTANKTSVNEGEGVRFTVTANNLPDGQILDWSIKEGVLNSTSNNITSPDKTDSGTVILKNGQAIIDFITTSDDNLEEPQKHVLLIVGAPADLSINVPISDAGHKETVIHISQSTTNGIDLAEYFKSQSGSYPNTTDTVRFIIDAGVDIIAPDTATPALTEGVAWPTGNTPIVENHGRILGRGGDGGFPATAQQNKISNTPTYEYITTPSASGGTGGTAIKGAITVENYSFIAGGGGGGGGAGFFMFNDYSTGFSGGAGGGAPLGRRYPNPKSYEEYLEVFNAPSKYTLPSLENPTSGRTYDNYNELVIHGSAIDGDSYIRGEIFSGVPLKSDIIRIAGYPHPVSTMSTTFYIPNYLDGSKTDYRLWSWADDRGWVNGFRQSTNATIETKGSGGLVLTATNGGTGLLLTLSQLAGLDISKNKGGDGGAYGENGEAALLGEFYTTGVPGDIVPSKVAKVDLELFIEPAFGGLAGYIKEGSVNITNFGSGTTKGR